MESTRWAAPPDPEFRTPVESWPTRYPTPGSYLRVLANPFLGVASLFGVAGLVRSLHEWTFLGIPPWVFFAVSWGYLQSLPMMFQYHCLDCGTTGPLRDWKSQTCFPSSLNRFLGRRGWFSWPRPAAQILVWLLVFVCLIPLILRAARLLP